MIQSVQNFLRPDIERRLTAKKRLDDLAESTLLENIDILEKSLHSKMPQSDHSADQLLQCQQGQTTWTEFLEDQHQGLNLNAELQWVQSFHFKLPNFQFLNNKELSIA